MKGKIFWVSILIIILSFIGNFMYFQSKQLDAPIFLDHYYELTMYKEEETTLTFYYLTNKSDTSTVNYVMIDGVEAYPASNNNFFMWESQAVPQFENEYTHHYLKALHLTIPGEYEGEGPLSFSDIEVHFSNGITVQADIGEVILKKRSETPDVLESRMSYGSNQHFAEQSMVAIQPITIEKVEIPFAEEISDDILVKVNLGQEKLRELNKHMTGGSRPVWFNAKRDAEWNARPGVLLTNDILPFKLEQNEGMPVMMQFNPTRESYFQFSIKLIGKTESDEEFVNEIPTIDHPNLDQEAINRIIAKKDGES
ncbi:hypothetical protein V7147_07740 [Bacillus sp. JJ1521]|uniref:hypothetical protein n=1 Tax=Bacillus sp. JJ1521 TaxID=3122957 RepID=UPI002FFFDC61